MREHPIISSTEMVRATLDGRKTKTRRTRGLEMINKAPHTWKYVWNSLCQQHEFYDTYYTDAPPIIVKCPYGQVGDRLWVRETLFRHPYFNEAGYVADQSAVMVNGTIGDMLKWRWKHDILPARFMPKEASRIALEIISVRVERINDISESDARAEGFVSVSMFHEYWDSLNAKRGYPWKSNPWVWVIEWPPLKAMRQ